MLKRIIPALFLTSLLFASCKKDSKDSSISTIATAEFDITSPNVYLNQSFSPSAQVDNGTSKYTWDYGDGTVETASKDGYHVYTKAGKYKVTLSVGGKTASKNIRVYPGNCSFQIRNNVSNRPMSAVITSTKNDKSAIINSSTTNLINGSATSDTIFVTVSPGKSALDFAQYGMLTIGGNIGKLSFTLTNAHYLQAYQHVLFTVIGTDPAIITYQDYSGYHTVRDQMYTFLSYSGL